MAGSPGGKEKRLGEGNGTISCEVPLKGRTKGNVGKAANRS